MKTTPLVYLVCTRQPNLQFGNFIQAAKVKNIELDLILRDENIISNHEFKEYNHAIPTFAVIDEWTHTKASKKIAQTQLNSAIDQLFLKALMYYPSVILISKSDSVLDKHYSEYKEIMVLAKDYEGAIEQILEIVHLRSIKKQSNENT